VEADAVLFGASNHQHLAQNGQLLFSWYVGQHRFLRWFLTADEYLLPTRVNCKAVKW
jgi:hypothetical protein